MVFSHVVEFLVNYFNNLNLKKIIGGAMVLLGLGIFAKMGVLGDPNKAVLYAIVGIIVGGVGLVIIYFDMAKDKSGRGFDEEKLLVAAYKDKAREKKNMDGWHIDSDSSNQGNEREIK